mgnify:CR=1 FL=1
MKKPTVLIVDSDEYSRLLLEEMLHMMSQESESYQILSTSYGKEAINFCNECWIDLILIEIHLKNMEGWELIQKIKGLYPSISIIIQTALVMDNTEKMVRESGADSFIAKPVELHKLQNMIKSVL